jgi:hypothetical protein
MKPILFCFLLIPVLALSQKINSTDKKSNSNIYNDAILRYIVKANDNKKTKHETLYVMQNDIFTDSLLSLIKNTDIKVIDGTQTESQLAKGDFILHKFSSLQYRNGLFIVSVVPFTVRKIENEVTLGNSGGCEIKYTFDSKLSQFKFIKVDCLGL